MRHTVVALVLGLQACATDPIAGPEPTAAAPLPTWPADEAQVAVEEHGDLGGPDLRPAPSEDLGEPAPDLGSTRSDLAAPADLRPAPAEDLARAPDLLEPAADLEPAPIAQDCLVDGDQCGQQVAHRCGVVAHNCGCCGLSPCDDRGQPSPWGRCFVGLRVWSKPGVGFVCVACNP